MTGFIAALVLLIIASIVNYFTSKYKLPYTIILFVIGVLIIPLTNIPFFSFLNDFEFTPDLLFFVFLPVLIFESGYKIKYHHLAKNSIIIRTLAIIGLLLSATIIGFGGQRLLSLAGVEIPLIIMILFGIIISATDPVAVLAIFKDLGTPKRLSLLFEGESLFNDGTAVAVFLILLEIIQKGILTNGDVRTGIRTFLTMVIGGIVVGLVFGFIFAKGIKYIKNNEPVEITLTVILAHFTFIFCELISHHLAIGGFAIKISGVIATAYAAIIMGNYGKTKISPRVEAYMDKFRNFFAFLTNSLIFILMGLILKNLTITWTEVLLPISLGILVVAIARAISTYLPIQLMNRSKKVGEHIPRKRQHLMARGSLRGAVGLTLALMIPEDLTITGRALPYSIKEFILAMTIGGIMFSLLVKGLTMKPLIKKLKLDSLKRLEIFERYESEILIYSKIINKIQRMKEDYHTSKKTYDILINKYETKLEEARLHMQIFLQQQENPDQLIHSALSLHALGVEKEYLQTMFTYHEIDEYLYLHLLHKLERQIERIEKGEQQIQPGRKPFRIRERSIVRRCTHRYSYQDHSPTALYHIQRTKFIVTAKVIKKIEDMSSLDFGFDSKHFENILTLYKGFHQKAKNAIKEIRTTNENHVIATNAILLNKGLMKTEEKEIKDLYSKEMITPKLYKKFMEEIDNEIFQECG